MRAYQFRLQNMLWPRRIVDCVDFVPKLPVPTPVIIVLNALRDDVVKGVETVLQGLTAIKPCDVVYLASSIPRRDGLASWGETSIAHIMQEFATLPSEV